ncbi:MAG TPA: cupin domain-containing protein [Spirochaetes bacterium]|nr:cupin domain-containing protein [Spirochaetota bacterium]
MVIKKRDDGLVRMIEGVTRQNLAMGEKTHMVKFFFEKGSVVPVHSHSQEQTGYLIKGKIVLTIDGVEQEIDEGDSWSIGGNISHGAAVPEDSVAVEVFSPIREDYLDD